MGPKNGAPTSKWTWRFYSNLKLTHQKPALRHLLRLRGFLRFGPPGWQWPSRLHIGAVVQQLLVTLHAHTSATVLWDVGSLGASNQMLDLTACIFEHQFTGCLMMFDAHVAFLQPWLHQALHISKSCSPHFKAADVWTTPLLHLWLIHFSVLRSSAHWCRFQQTNRLGPRWILWCICLRKTIQVRLQLLIRIFRNWCSGRKISWPQLQLRLLWWLKMVETWTTS